MRPLAGALVLTLISISAPGALVTNIPWKNREVPYVIDTNVGNDLFIRGAIDAWNRALGVNILRPKQPTDTHWVVFRAGIAPGETGCQADIGFNANKNPHEIYADTCIGFRTVIHEIGHVLGMEHEHQRCDAPEYIRLTPAVRATVNTRPKLDEQYIPKPCLPDLVGSTLRVPSGPYDFLSVMHYPPETDEDEDLCLASGTCLRFTLTEKGENTLRAISINSIEELADRRKQLEADCVANLRNCLTPEDLRAAKDLYGIP